MRDLSCRVTKYLSVNSKIHENMGTSELNECQPIFRFLRPAGADATTFRQPTECSLDHPATGWKLGFAGHGTVFKKGFIATSTMFDMSYIAFLCDELMNICEVVALVQTRMLLKLSRVRPRDYNGHDDLIQQPFIMDIGSSNVDRQGCATLIDQNMDLAASFRAVNRTL